MLKDNLKFLAAVLVTVLVFLLILKTKSYLFPERVVEENQLCIVTQVEFHQIGSASVFQVNSEWRATTDCGHTYTSRKEVKIGDTVRIKILKLRRPDRIFK